MMLWHERLTEASKQLRGISDVTHTSEDIQLSVDAVMDYIGQDELTGMYRKIESGFLFRTRGFVSKFLNDPEQNIKKNIRVMLERDPAVAIAVSRAILLKIVLAAWAANTPYAEASKAVLASLGVDILQEVGVPAIAGQDVRASMEKPVMDAISKEAKKAVTGQTTVSEIIAGAESKTSNDPVQDMEHESGSIEELPGAQPEQDLVGTGKSDDSALEQKPIKKKRIRKEHTPSADTEPKDEPRQPSDTEPKDEPRQPSDTEPKDEPRQPSDTEPKDEPKQGQSNSPAVNAEVPSDKQEKEAHGIPGPVAVSQPVEAPVNDEDPLADMGKSQPCLAAGINRRIVYIVSTEYAGADVFIRDVVKQAYKDNISAVKQIKYNIDTQELPDDEIVEAVRKGIPVIVWNYPYKLKSKLENKAGIGIKMFVVTGSDKPVDYSDQRKLLVRSRVLGDANPPKTEYTHVTMVADAGGTAKYQECVEEAAGALI